MRERNSFSEIPARVLKPLEQRLARRPRERSSEHRLFIARRLAYENHFAHHRPAAHDGFVHLRTTIAREQLLNMRGQQALG
jgi:hypothetical protein